MSEKTYKNRHRVRAEQVKAAVDTVVNKETNHKSRWQRMEITEGPSSVGVSITIGESASYGSEKWSATITNHVSHGNVVEKKDAAFTEALSFCMEKVLVVREEICSNIFPNTFKRDT
tara:strand:- start:1441 stop:1791 length:351 start_codon:yes stop_codon:yes gene_type:complete